MSWIILWVSRIDHNHIFTCSLAPTHECCIAFEPQQFLILLFPLSPGTISLLSFSFFPFNFFLWDKINNLWVTHLKETHANQTFHSNIEKPWIYTQDMWAKTDTENVTILHLQFLSIVLYRKEIALWHSDSMLDCQYMGPRFDFSLVTIDPVAEYANDNSC